MKNCESEEMYLETIYVLNQRGSRTLSVDVARKRGFSKASVCIAMKRLREKDYITVDGPGNIRLTERGKQAALRIYEKHRLLTRLFINMGADIGLAEENACRIEHVISPEMVEIIRDHLNSGIKRTSLCERCRALCG